MADPFEYLNEVRNNARLLTEALAGGLDDLHALQPAGLVLKMSEDSQKKLLDALTSVASSAEQLQATANKFRHTLWAAERVDAEPEATS